MRGAAANAVRWRRRQPQRPTQRREKHRTKSKTKRKKKNQTAATSAHDSSRPVRTPRDATHRSEVRSRPLQVRRHGQRLRHFPPPPGDVGGGLGLGAPAAGRRRLGAGVRRRHPRVSAQGHVCRAEDGGAPRFGGGAVTVRRTAATHGRPEYSSTPRLQKSPTKDCWITWSVGGIVY